MKEIRRREMESLLPSEIARLVFGYLEEQGCQKAAQALLEELPDLAECAKLRRKGKRIKKKVGDKTLVDMLQDYSAARDEIQEAFDKYQKLFSSVSKNDALYEQIKALLSCRILGWQKSVQPQGVLCTSSEAQRARTMKLLKFHKAKVVTGDSSVKQQPNLVLDVNATQIEDLPGCSQSTSDLSYHVEDGHPVMPYMSEASSAEMSHLSVDSEHIAGMVDSGDLSRITKDDKVTGDRAVLPGQEMAHLSQVTPQKRKGQVRRRSMSSPKSSSPFAEEDFEKILKNLYENTALHEKIAENINRGLNCTKQMSGVENAETLSPHAIPQTQPLGKEKEGSSDTFVHELDQMVNNIISETTADPIFENLVGDVFVSSAPMSSPQISNTSRQPKTDMLHQFVCNLSSSSQGDRSDEACQRNGGDEDVRNKSVMMVPVAGQNSEVRVEIMDEHLHKNELPQMGKPFHNRSEIFMNQLNSNDEESGPSSRPRRTCASKVYATKKKTAKKKRQTTAEKEAERKLGEDLIREFEEFQSKRPDRVSESETTHLADQGGLCSFIEHMDMPSLDITDPDEEVENTTKSDSVCETSEPPKKDKQGSEGGDNAESFNCLGSEVHASVGVVDEDKSTQPKEQGLSLCGTQMPTDVASSASGEQVLQSIESQGVQIDQSDCEIGLMGPAVSGHGDTTAVLETKLSVNSKESGNVDIGPVVTSSIQQDSDNFVNRNSPLNKVDFNTDIVSQPGTANPKEVIQEEGRDPLSLSSPSHVQSVTVKTTTVPGISVAGCTDVIPDNLKGSGSPYTLTELAPMNIQQQETFEQFQQAQAVQTFQPYQSASFAINTDGPGWTPYVQGTAESGSENLEPQSTGQTVNALSSVSTTLSQENTSTAEEKQKWDNSTNVYNQQSTGDTSSLTKVKSLYLTAVDPNGVLKEGQVVNIPLAEDVAPKITVLQIKPPQFATNMRKYIPIQPKIMPGQQNKSSCAGTSNSMEISDPLGVSVPAKELKVSNPGVAKKAAEVPKKVKKKHRTNRKDDMNNDIVSRALSFALSSVTPKKVSPKGSDSAIIEVAEAEAGELHAKDRSAMDATSAVVPPNLSGGSTPQGPQQSKDIMNKQLDETSEYHELDKNEKGDETKREEICTSHMKLSPVLKKLLSLSQKLSPDSLKGGVSDCQSAMKALSPVRVQVSARKCRSTPSRKSGQARAVRALDFSTPCKNKSQSRSPSTASVSLRFSPKTFRNVSSPSKLSPSKKKNLVLKNTPTKTFSQNENTQHEAQTETVKSKTSLMETPREKTPKKTLPRLSQHKTPTRRTPPKRGATKLNHSKGDANQVQKGSEKSSREYNASSLVHKGRNVSVVKARMSPARKTGRILRNTGLAMIPEERECQAGGTNLSTVEKNNHEDDEESLVLQMEEDSEVASQNCNSEHLEMSVCETSSSEDVVPFKKLEKSPGMEVDQATPLKLVASSNSIDLHLPVFDTPVVYSPSDQYGPGNNDLNTPIIPNMHQDLDTSKTPRLKDYPQGPYSNSSVATSYYHPSENSVTDSDGMTSPRLIMDDHSIDSSPVALAVQQLSDVSSDVSPNKRISPSKKCAVSGKVIGKAIEEELNKLFKSATQQTVQKETNNQEGLLGKQTKKKRAPSVNYLNVSESTCSEDEMEPTLSGSAKVRSKAKPSSSELNDSRSRTRQRKRNVVINENDSHISKEERKVAKDISEKGSLDCLDTVSKQDTKEGGDSVLSHHKQDVEDETFCGATSSENSVGEGRKGKSVKNQHSGMGSEKTKRYNSPKSHHTKMNFVDVFGSDISSSDEESGTGVKKAGTSLIKMVKSNVENKVQNYMIRNVEDKIEDSESKFSADLSSNKDYSSPKENSERSDAVYVEEKLEEVCSQSRVEDDADVKAPKTQRKSGRKSVQTKFLNMQRGMTTRSKSKNTSGVILKEVSIEIVASSKDHSETDLAQPKELTSSKLKETHSTLEAAGDARNRKVITTRSSHKQRNSQVKNKQQEDTPNKNIFRGEEENYAERSSESSFVSDADSRCKVNPSPFTLWGSNVRNSDKSYFSSSSLKSQSENFGDRWLECLGSKKSKPREKELNKDILRKLIPEGNEWWWKKIENDDSLVMPKDNESLVVASRDTKKKKKKSKKDKSKEKGCARMIDYKTSPLFKHGTPRHHIRDEGLGEMVNITPRSRRRQRYAEDGQKTPSTTESPAKICPRLKLSPAKSPYKGYHTTPQKSLFSPRKLVQRSIHFLNRKEQEHELESRQTPSENCGTTMSETEELRSEAVGADKDSASCSDEVILSNHCDGNDGIRKISSEKYDEADCCEESNSAVEGLNNNGKDFENSSEPINLSLSHISGRMEKTKTRNDDTRSTVQLDPHAGSESSYERGAQSRPESPNSGHSLCFKHSFSTENVSLPNPADKQNISQEKDNEAIIDKESKAITSKSRERYEVTSDDGDTLVPREADLTKKQDKKCVAMEEYSTTALTHEVLGRNYEVLELEKSINDKSDALIFTSNEVAISVNPSSFGSDKVSKKSREELKKKLIPIKDSEALDKSNVRTSQETSRVVDTEDIRESLQKEFITLHGVDAEGNSIQTTSQSSDLDENFWRIDKQLAEMHGLLPADQIVDIMTDSCTGHMTTSISDKESGGTNSIENQTRDFVKQSVVIDHTEKKGVAPGDNAEQNDMQNHNLLIRESEGRTKKTKSDESISHSDTKVKRNHTVDKEFGSRSNGEFETTAELDGSLIVSHEQCQNLVPSAQESSRPEYLGQTPQNEENEKSDKAAQGSLRPGLLGQTPQNKGNKNSDEAAQESSRPGYLGQTPQNEGNEKSDKAAKESSKPGYLGQTPQNEENEKSDKAAQRSLRPRHLGQTPQNEENEKSDKAVQGSLRPGHLGQPPQNKGNEISDKAAQESSRPGYLGQTSHNEVNEKSYEADLRREWNEKSKEHDEIKNISIMSIKEIPLERNSANGRQGEKEKSSSGSEISMEECPSPSDTDSLLTFTPLPNTPSKEVARICRDIVKEKCAMVAFPSESPTKTNIGTKSPVKERLMVPGNSEEACEEPTCLASRLVEVHQEPKNTDRCLRRSAYFKLRSDETQESPAHTKVRQILDFDTSRDKTDWATKGQEGGEEVSELKDNTPDLNSICDETGIMSSIEIVEKRHVACEDGKSDWQNLSNQSYPANLDSTYSYNPLESRALDRTIEDTSDEYEVTEHYLYLSPLINIFTMNIETPPEELHEIKKKKHSKKKSKHKKSPKKTPQKVSQSALIQDTLEEPGQWKQRMAYESESINWCQRSRSKSMSEMNKKSSDKESGSSCIQARDHSGRRMRTRSNPPTPGGTYSEHNQNWQQLSHMEKDALNETDLSKEKALGYAGEELRESDIKDTAREGTKKGQSSSWYGLQTDRDVTKKPAPGLELIHGSHDNDTEKGEPGSSGKMGSWLKRKKYVTKEFAKESRKSPDLRVDVEADLIPGELRDRQDSASPVCVESSSSCSHDKQKLLSSSGPQEVCYLLESESSIEATETEEQRQRHPRELSHILKSGSSLEIAKSPQKQLAIINTHEHYEAYFFIPDESNTSPFPPTPGKFFISSQTFTSTAPPTIQLPSATTSTQNSTNPQGKTFVSVASSCSSECSSSLPAPQGLPPKKRKFVETEPQPSKDAPVSKRRALKALSKMKDLETFLNKVHRP